MTPATVKMIEYLDHAERRDLSRGELFTLKAEAFELIRDDALEHDDLRLAADAGDAASRARQVAADDQPTLWAMVP